MSKGNKSENARTRNYTCLVYPESAPVDWLEILRQQFVPAFVSPLHDQDIVVATGEIKKPHHHVLIMFDSVKTIVQARELIEKFGGVIPPDYLFVVNSIKGVARYLCHMDDPDKAQYPVSSVLSFCGADYMHVINMPSDRIASLYELMDLIEMKNFYRFDFLMRWCRIHRPELARAVMDHGVVFIKEYLKSRSLGMANMSPEEKELYNEWCQGN